MITIRKLRRQQRSLRFKLAAQALQELAASWDHEGERFYEARGAYLGELLELLETDGAPSDMVRRCRGARDSRSRFLGAAMEDLRYALLAQTGVQTGEWDLDPPEEFASRDVRPITVYLDRVRSPFNVGSVFRTAESFGVQEILLHPACASPLHPRARRSAMGCIDRIPWRTAEYNEIEGAVFALETGGREIDAFPFPQEGTVAVGSEESGVSPELLEQADRSLGRVSIPTAGGKRSLNLSVAYGILAFQWYRATASAPFRSPPD